MGAPTVTPLTERRHDGGYVVYEPGIPHLCRADIILLSGAGDCEAGLVLGLVGHALTGAAAAQGTNTGNYTFSAIAVGAGAVAGVYVVSFADATNFTVENPDGEQIGHGDTGVAFAAEGLAFTITAGATPAQPGDTSKITVAEGSGKYVPYDPAAVNGAEVAAAILFGGRDASDADKAAVGHVRGPMRVNAGELVWGAGVTTLQHRTDALAALQALGIQAT